jgi:hypothetical protein
VPAERVLTQRELRLAVLARQLLLRRASTTIPRALERMAGIQAQYAPSTYVRLWSCLDGFARDDLTRALERKRAVTGTLMRSTIHVVSTRDYWLFAAGVGPSRETWWLRTWGKGHSEKELAAARGRLRKELAGRTIKRDELNRIYEAHGSTVWSGAWIELVRVPPAATWEHRRSVLFRLAAEWIPGEKPTEEEGIAQLLRRYLEGFGPASLADAANWAGVPAVKMRAAAERLELRRFRDEGGKALVDVPRTPLPDASTAMPVRFLPTWDATLLVHVRRTQILPEHHRERIFSTKTPHSVGTVLVDGSVAASWRVERSARKATVVVEPFERLPRAAAAELKDEGAGLACFHEPDAPSFAVRVLRQPA